MPDNQIIVINDVFYALVHILGRYLQNTTKPMHKSLASTTLLVPWMIWKHHNDYVLESAAFSSGHVQQNQR
jgi:ABC-type proline/glycine betaine transport system ATPase subunit